MIDFYPDFTNANKNSHKNNFESSSPPPSESTPPNKVIYLQLIYVVAILFWIFLLAILELYKTDILGAVILAIPFVIFIFGYYNSHVITKDVEDNVFQANYLSIGLLIMLPLMTWINRDYQGDKRRFTSILVLALILIMVSLLDVWVATEWLPIVKHCKSVLQTTALVMLIYALYTYYVALPHSVLK